MSEVRFSNNDINFRSFAKEAVKISASNEEIQEKIQKLESLAVNNDGYSSTKERLLIQAFKENPNVIANLKIDAIENDFSLNINSNPIKRKIEPKDTAFNFFYENPLGAEIFDSGINKINAETEAEGTNPEAKLNKKLESLGNSKISEKATKFIDSLSTISNKKYASVYINELLENRQPKLEPKEIVKILDKINNIAKSDYPEAVGYGKDLALSALHDISFPSDVSQNNTGNCVATSAQIQMIIRSPEKYLVMLDTLSKNNIYETSKGSIKPNWTFANQSDFTMRTISSAIVQNAFVSTGKNGDYDSSDPISVEKGMHLNEIKKVYESAFGTSVKTKSLLDGASKEELFDLLASAKPSINNPIHITMKFIDEGRDKLHAVNVVSLNDENVTIINPWGREETFKTTSLAQRIREVLILNKK